MAINPLSYIVNRQYSDNLLIKNHIFKQRLAKAKNFYRKDLVAHYGCVNAIEFSAQGELLVSGGDDRRVLLWNVPDAVYNKPHPKSDNEDELPLNHPISMSRTHNSNIFCVAFDSENKKIFSGGNDDQVIVHELNSGNALVTISHRKPVYGLSVNPQNDEIISTAGEDGRLLLYDIREASNQEAQILAKQKTGFHSVMFNPTNPRYLVSANSEEGIAMWDCRKPKEELLRFDSQVGKTSGISACFDSNGKKVLALRRRLPPVLYSTQADRAVCQFYHPQYYNSCTMKTCSFAGENDEYVLSGSDDFNLYMWKIPEDDDEWGNSHVVLKGHRSIVNQVRYNVHNNLIASSGVEKMIKLWSTIPIGTWSGSLLKEYSDPSRIVYSHQDYVDLVGSSGERISHDYSDQSTLEDSKMMAFFDSLIQREIEGWASSEDAQTTDSDSEFENDYSKLLQRIYRGRGKYEESRKHKSNKIAMLISKKRYRLARMAYKKSYSSVQKIKQREKRKRTLLKQKTKDRFNSSHKKSPRKSSCAEPRNKLTPTSRTRYRTRQSVREENEVLDVPSTSTGITNSNSRYRVLHEDSESGEEVTNHIEQGNMEVNLVNILPTPLNGALEHVINVLEIPPSEVADNGNGNVVTVRSEEYNNGASTSRGTPRKPLKRHLDECPSTSNGVNYPSSSESDFEYDECLTPRAKRRSASHSDSGCGTGPSSTKSQFLQEYIRFQTRQDGHSSDEERSNERFRKRVRKARANLRNRVCADSDSN